MVPVWFFPITTESRASSTGTAAHSYPFSHFLPIMITINPRATTSKRITIVLHPSLFTQLQTRSDNEGRSLSNLCAYLLERAMTRD
jgi:hypothetical protein